MCSMALSRLAPSPEESPKRSVITFCPLSAAKVRGVTNSLAARVITTQTLWPSCCKRRTSSAALYAATPPVTPNVIRIFYFRWPLFLALAVLVLVDRCSFGNIKFEQAVLQLFAGNTRGLLRPGILKQGGCTGHNLPRAPCRKHHVRKLALRSFCLHGHLHLSSQNNSRILCTLNSMLLRLFCAAAIAPTPTLSSRLSSAERALSLRTIP